MAARLEAATKQFGVSLLLSEDFVECLSPPVRRKVRGQQCVCVHERVSAGPWLHKVASLTYMLAVVTQVRKCIGLCVQRYKAPILSALSLLSAYSARSFHYHAKFDTQVRQIDCVTVKGSAVPMGLFTYDVCLDRIPEPKEHPKLRAGAAEAANISSGGDGGAEDAEAAAAVTRALDAEATEIEIDLLWRQYGDEWEENPDLVMTWGIDFAFKEAFDDGFQVRTRNHLIWVRHQHDYCK